MGQLHVSNSNFNVNRPEDGRRADELLAGRHAVETETGQATRSPEEK